MRQINWRLLTVSVCMVFMLGTLFTREVVAALEARAYATERAESRQAQRDLVKQVARLTALVTESNAKNERILNYLTSTGVIIPEEVLTGTASRVTTSNSGDDDGTTIRRRTTTVNPSQQDNSS